MMSHAQKPPTQGLIASPRGSKTTINPTPGPLHPRFAELQARLESFGDPMWPTKCPVKPADLAAAGFYYYGSFEGINDSVKCFFCDAGLCLWERGDVPWTEHKRVSPRCPYVLNNHPDIVKEKELQRKRVLLEAARDPNEVINDWMNGLMVVQLIDEKRVSQTLVRNVLHKRWLKEKAPFESKARLEEAIDVAIAEFNMRFDRHVVSPLDNSLAQLKIVNSRTKRNSTGYSSESSSDEETGGMIESGYSSSQSSTCSSSSGSSYSTCASKLSDSSRLLCKVCLDNELEVVFTPCGHFVCCTSCSESLTKCPYCRKSIASTVKTYLS